MTAPGQWGRRVRRVFRFVNDVPGEPSEPPPPPPGNDPVFTIAAQPVNATDGLGVSPALAVQTVPPQAGLTVTATPSVGSAVGSTTAVTNANGLATFTTLGVNVASPPTSGVYFTVSASGYTSIQSGTFTVQPVVVAPGTMFPNAPSAGSAQYGGTWYTNWDAEFIYPPTPDGADNGSGMRIAGDPTGVTLNDIATAPWSAAAGKYITVRVKQGDNGAIVSSWVYPRYLPTIPDGLPAQWDRNKSTGAVYHGQYMRWRGSGGQPYDGRGTPGVNNYPNNGHKIFYYGQSPGMPDSPAPYIYNDFAHTWIPGTNDGDPDPARRGGLNAQQFVTQFSLYDNVTHTEQCKSRSTGWDPTYAAGRIGNTLIALNEQWYLVEQLFEPNTFDGSGVPQFNGRYRLWIDGTLLCDIQNFVMYGASQCEPRQSGILTGALSNIRFEPIYGAGLSPSPYDQFVDYGRMKVMYTRKP